MVLNEKLKIFRGKGVTIGGQSGIGTPGASLNGRHGNKTLLRSLYL